MKLMPARFAYGKIVINMAFLFLMLLLLLSIWVYFLGFLMS
jgi:hypothetical protein